MAQLYKKIVQDQEAKVQEELDRRQMYMQMLNEEREKVGAAKYDRMHNSAADIPKDSRTEKGIHTILKEKQDAGKRLDELDYGIFRINKTVSRIGV